MAKKLNKDEAFQAFIPELVAEFPEDLRDKVAEALKGSAKAKESFLRQSDYSRFMDEAKAERDAAIAAAQAEVEKAREVATRWDEWGKTSYSELSTATERLRKYEDTYGPIEGNVNAAAKPGFSKEEVEAMLADKLAERTQSMVQFADVLTDLKLTHRDSFKEGLDTQSLLKFSADNGLTDLRRAYDLWTAPRVAERRDAEHAEALKRAREEGAREALSNHKLPVGFARAGNPVLDAINSPRPETRGDRRDAALADLQSRLQDKFTTVGA